MGGRHAVGIDPIAAWGGITALREGWRAAQNGTKDEAAGGGQKSGFHGASSIEGVLAKERAEPAPVPVRSLEGRKLAGSYAVAEIYSRSAAASLTVSAIRLFTTSPIETMPHNMRPSSSTGT